MCALPAQNQIQIVGGQPPSWRLSGTGDAGTTNTRKTSGTSSQPGAGNQKRSASRSYTGGSSGAASRQQSPSTGTTLRTGNSSSSSNTSNCSPAVKQEPARTPTSTSYADAYDSDDEPGGLITSNVQSELSLSAHKRRKPFKAPRTSTLSPGTDVAAAATTTTTTTAAAMPSAQEDAPGPAPAFECDGPSVSTHSLARSLPSNTSAGSTNGNDAGPGSPASAVEGSVSPRCGTSSDERTTAAGIGTQVGDSWLLTSICLLPRTLAPFFVHVCEHLVKPETNTAKVATRGLEMVGYTRIAEWFCHHFLLLLASGFHTNAAYQPHADAAYRHY